MTSHCLQIELWDSQIEVKGKCVLKCATWPKGGGEIYIYICLSLNRGENTVGFILFHFLRAKVHAFFNAAIFQY